MARILKGSHSFTCTPRVHLLMESTISAFAFPAEAGTHLLTPAGRKTELAFCCCYECPNTGLHVGGRADQALQ